jgi:hypothetical protein
MNVPSLNKFQGTLHVLSDLCVLGHSPENEWYVWFTPKRGESKTFVVDTVAEGLDTGETIEIQGKSYRVDGVEIYKRNKKGKLTLTLL